MRQELEAKTTTTLISNDDSNFGKTMGEEREEEDDDGCGWLEIDGFCRVATKRRRTDWAGGHLSFCARITGLLGW